MSVDDPWDDFDSPESGPMPDYEVVCARCGTVGWASKMCIEEGDEWECPPCNELENKRERACEEMTRLNQEMGLYDETENPLKKP